MAHSVARLLWEQEVGVQVSPPRLIPSTCRISCSTSAPALAFRRPPNPPSEGTLRKTAPAFEETQATVSLADLEGDAQGCLLDCDIRQHSALDACRAAGPGR